jgi:F-type H+-transporting ATPase subunit gamma
VPIARTYLQLVEAEKAGQIKKLIVELSERFVAGEVGRVLLAYNHYRSPISQDPRIVTLLPIEPPEAGADAGEARDEREILFEPSRRAVLDQLLPDYLENQCFLALLNTEAGEHGARMVAMDGATRNAGEMIRSLTLKANKARQAAITKELIEIVSGAQSL